MTVVYHSIIVPCCQGYSDPLEDNDINEFLAVFEIPPDYSSEFGEFAGIIMINRGPETPASFTS